MVHENGGSPRRRRVAIYCRVSTSDQNCDRQERDLLEYAERAGFEVVEVFKETLSANRPVMSATDDCHRIGGACTATLRDPEYAYDICKDVRPGHLRGEPLARLVHAQQRTRPATPSTRPPRASGRPTTCRPATCRAGPARAGSRRTRLFHARGSAAHPGSTGWHVPPPRRKASRTPVRSPRHGSSGPPPPSPSP